MNARLFASRRGTCTETQYRSSDDLDLDIRRDPALLNLAADLLWDRLTHALFATTEEMSRRNVGCHRLPNLRLSFKSGRWRYGRSRGTSRTFHSSESSPAGPMTRRAQRRAGLPPAHRHRTGANHATQAGVSVGCLRTTRKTPCDDAALSVHLHSRPCRVIRRWPRARRGKLSTS